MSDSEALKQAEAKRDAFSFVPTSLITYRSSGQIIALGDDQSLQKCCELPSTLNINQVSSNTDGAKIEVEGYLGEFLVRVTDTHANITNYQADAILDLHAEGLLRRELLPPGYFHVPPNAWDLESLTETLGDLVGEFEKPRYFDYDASICAHSVNGNVACSKCIDACPAEAIISIGECIEVNPNLCQGGGACTAVCPSGAIRYRYPSLLDSCKRMREMLQTYHEHGGKRAVIMFHSESCELDMSVIPDNGLILPVEELASVGVDLCLSALAYGAFQIILCVDDQVPAKSRTSLDAQLQWLQELLVALGLNAAVVTSWQAGEAIPLIEQGCEVKPAILEMPDSKRSVIYQAMDHLVNQLKPTAQSVELPQPAPFGEVQIDAVKCTLCMACVGSCPGRALQDGSNREVPEVFFIENNCLQCGACVQTCPEDAMQLVPRFLFDREKRHRSRALNQDTPFACIGCGKPFAPTSVINKMLDKLKDHYMYETERALDRLKMCEDCRVVDIMQDPEAMGGQFDPLKKFQ
jgi:ferredoxin